MKRFVLMTGALLAFLCLPCAAHAAVDDTASEVPLTFEQGHVIVLARVNGEEPVEVVLATGSEHSVVDGGMLEKYKLRLYYTGEGIITGGPTDRTITFASVPNIRVGDVKMTNLNMHFGSLEHVSKRLGRQIFGIFGADFFKGRVVQFDFGKKVVRFLPQPPAGMAKDAKPGDDAGGRVVLPMGSYKDGLTLPIIDKAIFDGKEIKTLLDTGMVTVVSLKSSAIKRLGLSSLPEKSPPRADKVSSLRFGSQEVKDVPVTLYAKGSDFDRDIQEVGAVAGALLLQNFVVTFDFRRRLVMLEHL
ncbi:MAG TPA: aspartyl protease family protein [Pyrinomonadaceae bacterium]